MQNRFGAGTIELLQLYMGYLGKVLYGEQKLRKKNKKSRVMKYCTVCGFGNIHKFKQANKQQKIFYTQREEEGKSRVFL